MKLGLSPRFAARENIGDEALREAADRASRGLVDADLGGGVVKQRSARPEEGRSGGVRAILLGGGEGAGSLPTGLRRATRRTCGQMNSGRCDG